MLNTPTRWDSIGNGYLDFYSEHNAYHPGVDLNFGKPNDDLGQEVLTPALSRVVYVSPKGNNGGFGLYVVLYHPNLNVWTRYLHLNDLLNNPQVGQQLPQGWRFATVGKSGTQSPHLHFEVFNEKGIAYIKGDNGLYGRYFGGKSKAFVASLTLDPLEWLRETTDVSPPPDWKQEAQEWAVQTGLIINGWELPDQPISQVRLAAILKKFAAYMGKA